MSTLRFALVASVALCAVSCASNPHPGRLSAGPYVLRGTVLDSSTGLPLGGSRVRVFLPSSTAGGLDSLIQYVDVDWSGRFTLVFQRPGRYHITGVFIGFRPVTVAVELPRDSELALILRLAPAPGFLDQ